MAIATPPRDQLSATFSALVEGEAPVKELAEPFAMSMPAVSKHLKVLERAGLIERSRHAQWRPCRLAPEPLKAVADWVEEYRGLWENRLDRLDDYLNELQAKPASDPPHDARTKTTRRASTKEQHDGRKR